MRQVHGSPRFWHQSSIGVRLTVGGRAEGSEEAEGGCGGERAAGSGIGDARRARPRLQLRGSRLKGVLGGRVVRRPAARLPLLAPPPLALLLLQPARRHPPSAPNLLPHGCNCCTAIFNDGHLLYTPSPRLS